MQSAEEILGLAPGATVEEVRAAYRALARRWHPDRFKKGPERDWASEHMAQINTAYRVCLRKARSGSGDDLTRARALIEDGSLKDARALLMSMNTRCAEWNYLFGMLLLRLRDLRRALIYLGVAAHQEPGCPRYAAAYAKARNEVGQESLRRGIFRR